MDRNYYKTFPWKRIFNCIETRCNNLNHSSHKHYGARGIKNYLTKEDIKFLWFRDKACEMKKPSIDRIDNDGHYTLGNCRFIELHINAGKDKKLPILQYSLNGIFIKEWSCAKEVENTLSLDAGNIAKVLRGKQKTLGNFIWKYKIRDIILLRLNIEEIEKTNSTKEKIVLQFSLNNIFIKEWKSLKDASLMTGTSYIGISSTVNGYQKSSGGFLWKFKT